MKKLLIILGIAFAITGCGSKKADTKYIVEDYESDIELDEFNDRDPEVKYNQLDIEDNKSDKKIYLINNSSLPVKEFILTAKDKSKDKDYKFYMPITILNGEKSIPLIIEEDLPDDYDLEYKAYQYTYITEDKFNVVNYDFETNRYNLIDKEIRKPTDDNFIPFADINIDFARDHTEKNPGEIMLVLTNMTEFTLEYIKVTLNYQHDDKLVNWIIDEKINPRSGEYIPKKIEENDGLKGYFDNYHMEVKARDANGKLYHQHLDFVTEQYYLDQDVPD